MGPVAVALAPVFALILIGAGLRRARLVDDAFWPAVETLVYVLFFPALLFRTMASARLDAGEVGPMAAALALAVWGAGLAALAVGPRRGLDGPAFAAVFQGAIRPNTYVGLAAAAGLYGEPGLALAAVAIAVVVPSVNLLSVAALARHGAGDGGGAAGPAALARAVAGNPLILAVVAGIAANLAGLPLVEPIDSTLEILARTALPLGLLAVGAGLDLGAARRAAGRVAMAATGKLAVMPALTAAACLALGVEGAPAAVAVIYTSLPTAASAYVLSRKMGGDAPLTAGIITATTIAAVATVPAVALILGRVGWGGAP
ncbi:MAG: AEC family transporter [Azospirillaceae bacterium]